MQDLYLHAQASLFSMINGLIANLSTVSPGLKIYKFDAGAAETKLPEHDLIGPYQFVVTNEDGLLTITAQIVVCTNNDKNLFRMDEIINAAFNKLSPGAKIPLVHYKTSTPLGLLCVSDETTVLPIESAAGRPIKSIAIELRSDQSMPRL